MNNSKMAPSSRGPWVTNSWYHMSSRHIYSVSRTHDIIWWVRHELTISSEFDTHIWYLMVRAHVSRTHDIIWVRDTHTVCVTIETPIRSRRRSYLKYLDLQILRFSRKIFWVPGTPFTHVQIRLKIWGVPWKRVWYVRGLLWKFVSNFGSRNYFMSDLLRLWATLNPSRILRIECNTSWELSAIHPENRDLFILHISICIVPCG